MVHALENGHHRYHPNGYKIQVGDTFVAPAALSASQMNTTCIEAEKVEALAGEICVNTLIDDPLRGCPICADSARESLCDGKLALHTKTFGMNFYCFQLLHWVFAHFKISAD